jgi:hypothetical protein
LRAGRQACKLLEGGSGPRVPDAALQATHPRSEALTERDSARLAPVGQGSCGVRRSRGTASSA